MSFYLQFIYIFLGTKKVTYRSLIAFHKRKAGVTIKLTFLYTIFLRVFQRHDGDNSFAWKPPEHTTASATGTTTTTTTSSVSSPTRTSFASWNGTISHFSETKSGLPPSQSPTITLLQKSRGTLPPFIIVFFVC